MTLLALNVGAMKSMLRRCAAGMHRSVQPAPQAGAMPPDHRPERGRSGGFGLLVGVSVDRRD